MDHHPRTSLARLRGKRTQAEVARALGIARAYYTQLELGTRRPSLEMARRMARYYSTTVEELFPAEGEQPREARA